MRKYITPFILLMALILICGCGKKRPQTFNPVSNPSWSTFEIREDINFSQAWQTINDILIDNYQLEFINKDIGYVRTSWQYGYNEDYEGKYRSMVEIKFSPDQNTIKIRTTSHFKEDDDYWVEGTDSKLISSLKSDILGHIGRTSR
ncbi:MAG: hypothetical protein U5L07_17100 [Desulfobacterales bacterium]|nr:hypothetical protein [Desulfobacterales bacterium]